MSAYCLQLHFEPLASSKPCCVNLYLFYTFSVCCRLPLRTDDVCAPSKQPKHLPRCFLTTFSFGPIFMTTTVSIIAPETEQIGDWLGRNYASCQLGEEKCWERKGLWTCLLPHLLLAHFYDTFIVLAGNARRVQHPGLWAQGGGGRWAVG